ncbi:5-oxoprolinase subunit B family protein [Nocardia seriolae]|uniref:Allophanate hydrolase n=2 Tax=Nocardia seriolae TaxID=37332 RepID=A0ABC8AKQ5_9NOCA|nr:allophanate hydrolase subunit 1 [Nocardia seriolae]APA94687.1 Allophanate hydrolase [Nocardia seriolae]MTJ59983.1 carboxyltransferase domain-containing protein [Nocardia seriolae]MTJ70053.1 carboxyltransferase domain-containing protein [Nocardia seriolae]MTJ84985.1 carboxyltransferase domain-containing protein [Nocardia seriolae]MTK28981.1 carboxyltransferase domain-containing protein [Nocardia seriolae]
MTDPRPFDTSAGQSDFTGEVRAAGDLALLVIPPLRAMIADLVSALRTRPAGVVDVLPAAETVLVILASPAAAESVRKQLRELLTRLDERARVGAGDRRLPGWRPDRGDRPVDAVGGNGLPGEPLLIPVRYDGADLAAVARLLGLTVDEVIALHTGTVWRCAFAGFAPGFGYLESSDGRLTVPRRTQSRTSIPAGAVALAGGYSAVYPRSSPGGWQLIGTTALAMWDVDREPPALVRAGARVRFVEVGVRS